MILYNPNLYSTNYKQLFPQQHHIRFALESDCLLLALTCLLASNALFSELFVYNAAIILVNCTNINVCVVMSTLLARML